MATIAPSRAAKPAIHSSMGRYHRERTRPRHDLHRIAAPQAALGVFYVLWGLLTRVALLPLLGGVSEYITAVGLARRNKMDLAVSVALGSTLLMALLVVPLLILLGPALGKPLDLSFHPFELVAIATAVLVSNLASLDGRSDWLEGVLLLAAYVILAAGFYFESAPIG